MPEQPPSSHNPNDHNKPSYGYGYGYGYYPETSYYSETQETPQRGFKDYLLIFRERFWYILVVFLLFFSGVLIYTLTRTEIYEARATVELLRQDARVIQVEDVSPQRIVSQEDLNTQIRIMESGKIIRGVSARLSEDERNRFLAPFEDPEPTGRFTGIEELLFRNREIVPGRMNLIVGIHFRHPDREVARIVANYFVEEYISHNLDVRIEEAMHAVDALQERANEQRERSRETQMELQDRLEEAGTVALDERTSIAHERLRAMNMRHVDVNNQLTSARSRWEHIREYEEEGQDLTAIPFIANQPEVSQLVAERTSLGITLSRLELRYRDGHPRMIEARESMEETQRALDFAVANAVAKVESDFRNTQREYQELTEALQDQEDEIVRLNRLKIDYQSVTSQARITERMHEYLYGRMTETRLSSTIESPPARRLDEAVASRRPVSPNLALNLGLGLLGGLSLGIGVAFVVAFLDDRVKSAFDIESVVGLPLLGILPEIKKLKPEEKVKIAFTGTDRHVVESFRSLQSSMRLSKQSSMAQCIMVTSTLPGEGKSFVSSNTALTYAVNGEKTILVDCDLRMPSVHKSHKLTNERGVLSYCNGSAELDDVIHKDVHPNFDVLSTGGRAKNPPQVLNSVAFEKMILELRKRYARVIVDTPPLAAVSDALIIMQHTDGALFAMKFNKVRRSAARHNVRRLLSSDVPVFGAVLNHLNISVGGYYYAQYYDKSYRDYYYMRADKGKRGASSARKETAAAVKEG